MQKRHMKKITDMKIKRNLLRGIKKEKSIKIAIKFRRKNKQWLEFCMWLEFFLAQAIVLHYVRFWSDQKRIADSFDFEFD